MSDVLQGYHLNLTFPLPDYEAHYQASPGGYLSSLLGHRGAGSLLSFLKSKKLAHHLTATHKQFPKARFSLMLLSIQLTDHGERHVDNIVKVRRVLLSLLSLPTYLGLAAYVLSSAST